MSKERAAFNKHCFVNSFPTMLSVPEPCKMSAKAVVQALNSDVDAGLTMGEAIARQHSHGRNEFVVEEKVKMIVK
jgi:hypothetical protein